MEGFFSRDYQFNCILDINLLFAWLPAIGYYRATIILLLSRFIWAAAASTEIPGRTARSLHCNRGGETSVVVVDYNGGPLRLTAAPHPNDDDDDAIEMPTKDIHRSSTTLWTWPDGDDDGGVPMGISLCPQIQYYIQSGTRVYY